MATLKASPEGLVKIKRARIEKGWSVNDFKWIESASNILGISWEETGVLALGISEGTWKRFLGGKHPINENAFKAYCQVLEISWEEVTVHSRKDNSKIKYSKVESLDIINSPHHLITSFFPYIDWSEAPDVSKFYGRSKELETLQRWIVEENCRLISLLGMGGIGKTTLSVRLAQEIIKSSYTYQSPIKYIIWRSLRNAPPINNILAQLIQFLSPQQEKQLPGDVQSRISLLLKYLRSQRCLLILDNFESILEGGKSPTSSYRNGYENYGQLLRCVAETFHQSCLILTSREKPRGLGKFEGESLPIRCLQLSGLGETEGLSLFKDKGKFTGSNIAWQTLISIYSGNPLALKIISSLIKNYFDANICQFVEKSRQNGFIFGDIRDLLHQQLHRLTDLEQKIMYWLAINREPVSLELLQADFITPVPYQQLLESLNSLQERSLVKKINRRFTQEPMVMEYVIDQLIEIVSQEIRVLSTETEVEKETLCSNSFPSSSLFITHALIKATAKDYLRKSQINRIIKPVIERLMAQFGSVENIVCHLNQILKNLRGKLPIETGYAAGNILNLLHTARINLSNFNFSGLTIWQAYLQNVSLHNVNFTASHFKNCTFTKFLGNTLSAVFSPDGGLLATCDTDFNVRIWEIQTGKLILICQGHTNWVHSVKFSPNGKILASCGADKSIKLWNVRDGVCIKTLIGHEHEVFSIAFNPDGKTIASASGDCTIKIWDVGDGTCIKTLIGHNGWVRCVAFNSNGQSLVTSSADNSIKLWHTNNYECVKTLLEHTKCVHSVAFSSDNETLGKTYRNPI